MIDVDTNFTLGILEQRRNETLRRLVVQNEYIEKIGDSYRTRNSQLKLNSVIQRIALLSSVNSAGSEDFKHTLEVNNFGYKFFVTDYNTIVQGENNSKLFFLGLIFGVLIGLGILCVAVYALYRGYPWVATAAFSALGIILMILVLRKMPSTSDSGTKPPQNQ